MEKEFVPYEQALALKELGFDFDVFRSYDTSVVNLDGQFLLDYYYNVRSVDEVKAPTFSQAFRWLHLKTKKHSYIDRNDKTYRYNIDFGAGILGLQGYKTYEEAELECLKKLIEIVKEK
jgi:hypothetical protein